MELHGDFTKIEYAPQSEAQLQNFKTLLLLEVALLMGTDLEWATGGAAAASAGPSGGPVLGSGAAGDDGEDSDNAPIFGAEPTAADKHAAAADKDDASDKGDAGAGLDDGAGAAGPAAAGAAGPAGAGAGGG